LLRLDHCTAAGPAYRLCRFPADPGPVQHLRGVFTCSSGWLEHRQQRQHLKSGFARLAIRRGLGRSGSSQDCGSGRPHCWGEELGPTRSIYSDTDEADFLPARPAGSRTLFDSARWSTHQGAGPEAASQPDRPVRFRQPDPGPGKSSEGTVPGPALVSTLATVAVRVLI
jgi:hypothetical protein